MTDAIPSCPGCRHERELRELWQTEHLERHKDLTVAVSTAASEINRRLDEMNELRKQIESERGQYVRRDMYDREHASLRDLFDNRIKALENDRSNLNGRLWAVGATIAFVLSVVTIGIRLLVKP